MLPDIVGYCLEDGMVALGENGINIDDIIINEYNSPRNRIMGTDRRIIKSDEKDGKVILIVGNF